VAAAIVLLHGQPGTGSVWTRVVGALPRDAVVLAPDRPGYAAGTVACDFARNADAVVAALDDRRIDRAVVVAHSWAGGIAVDLAVRHPERVAGLVLAASIGPGCVGAFDRLLARPFVGPSVTAVGFAGLRILLAARPLRARLARRATADAVDAARDLARVRHAWRAFVAEQRCLVDSIDGVVRDLAAVATPTVVVCGEGDRVVTPATARALANAIPGAELVAVRRAGHDLPHDAPDVLADAALRLTTAVSR
jgi:pimeloyl-ACP methyl ester carboxylesterase